MATMHFPRKKRLAAASMPWPFGTRLRLTKLASATLYSSLA